MSEGGGGGGRFTSSSWPSQDIYSAMCNVLAAIHSVDIEKSNLTDFGKHGELEYHILWCTVVYCGILWYTVICCGILWYTGEIS